MRTEDADKSEKDCCKIFTDVNNVLNILTVKSFKIMLYTCIININYIIYRLSTETTKNKWIIPVMKKKNIIT